MTTEERTDELRAAVEGIVADIDSECPPDDWRRSQWWDAMDAVRSELRRALGAVSGTPDEPKRVYCQNGQHSIPEGGDCPSCDRAEVIRTAVELLRSLARHAPAWAADGSDYRIDADMFRAAALDLDRLAPPEGTSE